MDCHRSVILTGCVYPVNFYIRPPDTSLIDIQKFKELAKSRLAILRLIEKLDIHPSFGSAETKNVLDLSLRSKLAWVPAKSSNVQDPVALGRTLLNLTLSPSDVKERDLVCFNDAVSHFILKLAFFQDQEKQEWFIKQESKFFQIKMDEARIITVAFSESKKNKYLGDFLVSSTFESPLDAFTKKYSITLPKMSRNFENNVLFEKATGFRQTDSTIQDIPDFLFMVPSFPHACSLIRNRKVFLKEGTAFLFPQDITSVFVSYFKGFLREGFTGMKANAYKIESNVFLDERIGPFVREIPVSDTGREFRISENDTERLTPSIIHSVYSKSFPPCMRRLFSVFLKQQHLRYWERQQLWLFFKGAGMSCEEQLNFNRNIWKAGEQFDKEHRYSIRHMYGQEGKRADYAPFNCSKIINGNLPLPGTGDHHGCPFKHFDSKHLKTLLLDYGVPEKGIQNILGLSETHQYQLACIEYFKQIHAGAPADEVGNHPNSFYRESIRFMKNKTSHSSSR